MATDFTSVNYSAMQTAQSQLQNAYSNLSEEIRALERKLETNLAQWEGDARVAYREAKAQWDAAMDHMQQVLNAAGNTVGQISGNYQTTDQTVAKSWG